MRIGLIDLDLNERLKSNFPNLALMKLSGHHKEKGDDCELLLDYSRLGSWDKLYIAKVFTDTPVPKGLLEYPNVEYGGTGFFFDKAPNLPEDIEHHKPDYDLYSTWANNKIKNEGFTRDKLKYFVRSDIGFTTRGCVRKCGFCVNQKYSKVTLHSPLSEFIDKRNSSVSLWDDNVLAYSHFEDLWAEIESYKKSFEFKQGMDFRLLNEKRTEMITNSKYYKKESVIYAFDSILDKDFIVKKLDMYRQINRNRAKFYVLCAYDRNGKYDHEFWIRDIRETFERIRILMEYGCVPFIMRFEKWKDSPYINTYRNLNKWCNYPQFYATMSYREMQQSTEDIELKFNRLKPGTHSTALVELWRTENEMPELAKEYFDLRYKDLDRFGIG